MKLLLFAFLVLYLVHASDEKIHASILEEKKEVKEPENQNEVDETQVKIEMRKYNEKDIAKIEMEKENDDQIEKIIADHVHEDEIQEEELLNYPELVTQMKYDLKTFCQQQSKDPIFKKKTNDEPRTYPVCVARGELIKENLEENILALNEKSAINFIKMGLGEGSGYLSAWFENVETDDEEPAYDYCARNYPKEDNDETAYDACMKVRTTDFLVVDKMRKQTLKDIVQYADNHLGVQMGKKYMKHSGEDIKLKFHDDVQPITRELDTAYIEGMWNNEDTQVGKVIIGANHLGFQSLCRLAGAKIAFEIRMADKNGKEAFEKLAAKRIYGTSE